MAPYSSLRVRESLYNRLFMLLIPFFFFQPWALAPRPHPCLATFQFRVMMSPPTLLFSAVYIHYICIFAIYICSNKDILFVALKKGNSLVAPDRKPLAIPSPLVSGPPLSRITVSTVGTCQVHAMPLLQPSPSDSPASIPRMKLPCPGSNPQSTQASV